MCGEKEPYSVFRLSQQGSPPRVRGKEWYLQGESPAPGITPACAGKRTPCWSRSLQYLDHPRVCGEKVTATPMCRSTLGSPPRVRGKGKYKDRLQHKVGITPACAGKRFPEFVGSAARWDHPRVCGEKPTQTAPTPVSPISSMARWVTRVPGPSSSTEMPAAGI